MNVTPKLLIREVRIAVLNRELYVKRILNAIKDLSMNFQLLTLLQVFLKYLDTCENHFSWKNEDTFSLFFFYFVVKRALVLHAAVKLEIRS